MLFKDSIPNKLQEYPNVVAFMDILDSLYAFKSEIISEALRVNNPALLMDRKWLLKLLSEYGITGFPLNYPIAAIQQFLLNADTILGTRGSKIGIELYCSVLSLGKVVVDDTSFYTDPKILLLDSPIQGYITSDNEVNPLYIVDDTSIINPETLLRIQISSKYFSGEYSEVIKSYIEGTIKDWVGFSNVNVRFVYSESADFYYHKLLNPYFI